MAATIIWEKVNNLVEYHKLGPIEDFMVPGEPALYFTSKFKLGKSFPSIASVISVPGLYVKQVVRVISDDQESATPYEPSETEIRIAHGFTTAAKKMQKEIDEKLNATIGTQRPTARRRYRVVNTIYQGHRLRDYKMILAGLAYNYLFGLIWKYPLLKGIRTLADVKLLQINTGYGSPLYEHYEQELSKINIRSQEQWDDAINQLNEMIEAIPTTAPSKASKMESIRKMELHALANNIPGFSPSSPQLISKLISLADIKNTEILLEPSAGKGDILDAISAKFLGGLMYAIEINESLREILLMKGYVLVGYDFLDTHPSSRYDKIIMHPPFEYGQDKEHLMHAFKLLREKGRVVAVIHADSFIEKSRANFIFLQFLISTNAYVSSTIKEPVGNESIDVRIVAINEDRTPIDRSPIELLNDLPELGDTTTHRHKISAGKHQYVKHLTKDLDEGLRHNKLSTEKLARSYGINDKTEIKELTEYVIVQRARKVALDSRLSLEEKYARIVDIYLTQVNLSHRTSHSVMLQQYSTPAPISFLAGIFVNADENISVFEPSAGNGLLTIAADPERVTVNEIDTLRRTNLLEQGYKEVLARDASQPFHDFRKLFDAVITNPPFGAMDKIKEPRYDNFPIGNLDHLMALRALDTMKDDGKAAIIIGGHNAYDKKGRFSKGSWRYFFNYLYRHYHVSDLINISGRQLFSRQGTAFNIRMILIDGRKEIPEGAAPLADTKRDRVVTTFDELYERITSQTHKRMKKEINWKDLEGRAIKYLQLTQDSLGSTDKEGDIIRVLNMDFKILEVYKGFNIVHNIKDVEELVIQVHDPRYDTLYIVALDDTKSKVPYKYGIPEANNIETARQYIDWITRDKSKDLGTIDKAGTIIRVHNMHVKILEGYKGFNIVHNINDVEDPVIQVHDPRYDTLYTVALDDSKMSVPYKRILWQYNTIEAARKYIDWLVRDKSEDLGMPYTPASNACVVLDTVVPDSMGYETHEALNHIKEAIGGDMDEYVRKKLNYKDKAELCKALSAEQIDAVAMAIYNIEERGQGMIIGDQTGIGKGRVAAAIIRYATEQSLQPVFITEKANLFSDIYRDLVAIGSSHLVPFIINARQSKTSIKDEEGNVVYEALNGSEQQKIFGSGQLPHRFDFVVATYSQFNSPDKKPLKPQFLNAIAEDNIVILDEAHNSSGSSNVGQFMQDVLDLTRGVVFLSATFAKRADNMPLYARKTCISEANMTRDDLVEAIKDGGVALQEVLASQLVAEGQMLRRERSFEGVEVNYITLTELEQEHKAISDNITAILRDIIKFQADYITPQVERLDDEAVSQGSQVSLREGTSQAGVDNTPYFSKVFNVINQMLFSIKAEAVADRAIMRLREGKKPVIAFSSTMGAFLENMENESGDPVKEGDTIKADFSVVLQRGLNGVMRYTETDPMGKPIHHTFNLKDLPPRARFEYERIESAIEEISTGISISPIDIIVGKLESAGYRVAEVTGRKLRLQFNQASEGLGKLRQAPAFKPGQVVTDIKTGKQGRIEYFVEIGDFIPGQPITAPTYEYTLKLADGKRLTAKESDLTRGALKREFTGVVQQRKKINTNDAFRQFNNNEVDVLLINQSGSTGASAHAIATAKVSKSQVKQRVMIVLQPELDINTEVQKRGRINRTGQIIKPIYDYVNSAIPAEARLMMMLQKKLKSLDANTTSNQKSSTKILDVPDFLNKIGDKVVTEYLKENPEVNKLLDDPLFLLPKKIKDQDSEEDEEEDDDSAEDDVSSDENENRRSSMEHAAHKASGRVAVLSSTMQQEFYEDVSARYNDMVEYLKQMDQYDLEVEAMDLRAETVGSRVLMVGKGGQSEFGDDSILETIMANVLRKPFATSELKNMLTESLQGKTAGDIQAIIKQEYEAFADQALADELKEIDAYYDKHLAATPEESRMKKLLETKGETEYQEAVIKRQTELRLEMQVDINKAKAAHGGRREFMTELFDFFYIGRNLRYPFKTFDSEERVFAVFLGFVINKKKKNPYSPSGIKLRIAIGNGKKYIAIPASFTSDIHAIKSVSANTSTSSLEDTLRKWEEAISLNIGDREERYVITGNILQAFGQGSGKLVSYTTVDGATKKGLLLPTSFNPGESKNNNVTVPVARAIKIIKSLPSGGKITTSNDVSIFRQSDRYKIVVASSKSKGGDVFLNPEILNLVDGNNFEKVSTTMTATLDLEHIDEFVIILQSALSASVELTMEQYESIRNDIPPRPVRTKQSRPTVNQEANETDPSIDWKWLELEAQALALEQEQLELEASFD